MITCEINTDLTTSIIYIEKDDRQCCTISGHIRELFIKATLSYCILENEKSCSSFVTLSLCVSMYFQTGESLRIV